MQCKFYQFFTDWEIVNFLLRRKRTRFTHQSCDHIETSQLTRIANQLTGFYMIATLTLNELMFLHCFTLTHELSHLCGTKWFKRFFEITLSPRWLPSWLLLVQSQQWLHSNNARNLFKVNIKIPERRQWRRFYR